MSSDHAIRYFASVLNCRLCPLEPRCCPNMPARRIARDINEHAQDVARRKMKTKAFPKSRDQRQRGGNALCAFEDASRLRASTTARTLRRSRRVPPCCQRAESQGPSGSPYPSKNTARASLRISCAASGPVVLGASEQGPRGQGPKGQAAETTRDSFKPFSTPSARTHRRPDALAATQQLPERLD